MATALMDVRYAVRGPLKHPGLAIGLTGAIALTRVMESLLFGIAPADPVTLGTVTALLALVLLACYLPARRAVKLDPLTALRYE